jgi:signal transduction histidine kinase
MKNGTQQKSLLIRETEVKFEGQVVRLISFADITSELDTKELESWQRLIRVLTHEIMNSISPVTSLTSVISGYFKNKENGNPLSSDMINDHIISKTLDGLDTIEETGKGLLDFVDKYRSLTSLPKPKPVKFSINNVFSQCMILMEAGMPDNIIITFESHPHDLELTADFGQVEQMLINLIKNAAEAIGSKEKGVIQLRAMREADWILVQIKDNGPGIDDASLEDIFVPFYTTKKNGSGIGLSISRQIMRNHNGTLSVESDTSVGAVFTLKFPLINFLP